MGSNQEFTGSFWDLLTPFGVLFGVALLSACLLHGATFLGLKAGEPVRSQASRLARRLRWITAVLVVAASGWTFALSGKSVLSAALLALTVVGIVVAAWSIGGGREGRAFAGTAVAIGSLVAGIFAGPLPGRAGVEHVRSHQPDHRVDGLG